MKVKLLVPRSGNNGPENIGDIIEVSAAEAEAMSAAGQCEILRSAAPEKATARGPKPERA